MTPWVDQEHDERWLRDLRALHSQGRDMVAILIVLAVFVLIVIAGSVTGVGQ